MGYTLKWPDSWKLSMRTHNNLLKHVLDICWLTFYVMPLLRFLVLNSVCRCMIYCIENKYHGCLDGFYCIMNTWGHDIHRTLLHIQLAGGHKSTILYSVLSMFCKVIRHVTTLHNITHEYLSKFKYRPVIVACLSFYLFLDSLGLSTNGFRMQYQVGISKRLYRPILRSYLLVHLTTDCIVYWKENDVCLMYARVC